VEPYVRTGLRVGCFSDYAAAELVRGGGWNLCVRCSFMGLGSILQFGSSASGGAGCSLMGMGSILQFAEETSLLRHAHLQGPAWDALRGAKSIGY
jgi:hypothetical protein